MDRVASRCWFRDKSHAWRQGMIKAERANKVDIEVIPDESLDEAGPPRGTVTCKKVDLSIYDESHNDPHVTDLSELNNFEEAPLLGVVRRRFFDLQVYTYVGEVMIAVNPYKYYQHLVEMPSPLTHFGRGDPPHVRAIASFAFRNIRNLHAEIKSSDSDSDNQGIIVSGESGAGKTEACKNVMKYLVALTLEYQQQSGVLCRLLLLCIIGFVLRAATVGGSLPAWCVRPRSACMYVGSRRTVC